MLAVSPTMASEPEPTLAKQYWSTHGVLRNHSVPFPLGREQKNIGKGGDEPCGRDSKGNVIPKCDDGSCPKLCENGVRTCDGICPETDAKCPECKNPAGDWICKPCNNRVDETGPKTVCYTCDLTGPDGVPDGVYDACYQVDTNEDGVKDSCCPDFRIEITFRDQFNNRSKSRAGVGEKGRIEAKPATGVTFTANPIYTSSDPSCVSINLIGDWTAGDHAGDVKRYAEVNGCKQSISLSIVEPGGLTFGMEPGYCVSHAQNTGSVGFAGSVYVTPADVSFNAIEVRESDAPADVHDGWFKDFFSEKGITPPPHDVDEGTWIAVDSPNDSVPDAGKGSKVVTPYDDIHSGGP